MHFKTYLYVIFVLLSTYSLTGIDFNKFIKPKHNIEVRVLVIIVSFIMGYILTNFFTDFLNIA